MLRNSNYSAERAELCADRQALRRVNVRPETMRDGPQGGRRAHPAGGAASPLLANETQRQKRNKDLVGNRSFKINTNTCHFSGLKLDTICFTWKILNKMAFVN